MPPESPNKEALNALTDLYYLYSDLATHLRASDESPQELDLFFTRPGGLKELLHKYYLLASLDPQEAGSQTESLTLESMLPRDNGIAFYQAHDELWSQIIDVTDALKGYNREQGAVGTPVPREVTEVVNEGRQILARRNGRNSVEIQNERQPIMITASGIGVPEDVKRYYPFRGGRKKAILKMVEKYPEALSAKAWAQLVGKAVPTSPEAIQQVSADVNDINRRFKKKLQLDINLIINRNGYLLNYDELNIEDKTESP